ncbi:MAG: hypothetical protein M3N32_02050 [Actinomycetota bacterium]|nr:hypothetical protein [Actinomycetota bacterium]
MSEAARVALLRRPSFKANRNHLEAQCWNKKRMTLTLEEAAALLGSPDGEWVRRPNVDTGQDDIEAEDVMGMRQLGQPADLVTRAAR